MSAPNSPLEVKLNLTYLGKKRMNKLWGKMRGREIAFGRNLVKMMKSNYGVKHDCT